MKSAKFEPKFILSLTFNAIALIIAGVFIAKRGGISYILSQIGTTPPETSSPSWADIYYQHRRSVFEGLPKVSRPIIFLGDSLTDSCEWNEILNHPQILNRGIIGDTTDGVLERLNPILASQPRQIFLMIGINDLARKKDLSEILANYQQILATIQQQSPQTEVYVKSVLPIHPRLFEEGPSNELIRNLNTQLQQLSDNFSYSYIDLHRQFVDENQQLDERYTLDGLHLNGTAYLIWKAAIENYVDR
ncbi:GDSL-type esterase/lipase family protein [Laspinema olomoucense]|uniref:GDSL-type esterase/lipase family protein n=1 Tax=Laspinema olomoucense D3b TaxID=2953688 RepID=A0ABT2NCE2_9CYAN|nr:MULTISPECIES: GDSL-type esterase/lipase family protein [unclassified Laspinema]MCT7980362.1 GDSL-type esterase/lipase family protein [Laspinema sp. D3b]MCT7989761.1 GDSL-type esterase/lipase family protein [Laspinema sp. D3a]